MIRKQLIQRQVGASEVFRLRGQAVSRLEAFSDAVFAFAVTLLVVTLQPPQNYQELLKVVQGLGAFALSFTMLFLIWYNHYRFFRRYGLEDGRTALLNAVLLFVVLFYVYPLRFIFTVVVTAFIAPDGLGRLITADQLPGLYAMYGAGVVAVFLIFALLNLHAYHLRAALDLSPREAFGTQSSITANLVVVAIAVVSMLLGLTQLGAQWGLPGWIYVCVAPTMIIVQRIRRRQWDRRAARDDASPAGPPIAPA
ncbi:MAG TPA: TMEM175 family protein [Ktedonobacterales bacterium]|jgi:uncharacterized membrane protein